MNGMKKSLLVWSTVAGATCFAAEAAGRYTYDAESLVNYEVPEWYQDAKLGVWPIWGVYSVPAFGDGVAGEFYAKWMYADPQNNFMMTNKIY